MPTQRVTIAKLTGDAAVAAALRHFERWRSARVVANEDGKTVEPEQWPEASRSEMDSFIDGLKAASSSPPICFYLEYVDMWSGGYLFNDYLFGELPAYLAANERAELVCYALPDDGKLLQKVTTELRRRQIRARQPHETRWYLQFMLEAIYAWECMARRSLIIVIRSVMAGLVTDEEFEAALRYAPDWISAIGIQQAATPEP